MFDGLLIAIALLLVLLNGFFVAAEFAIVKLRPTRIKSIVRRYGLRGRLLAKVHRDLDAYLSACQLGITLASLGLGWIGEPAFARLLEPTFAQLGIDDPRWVHGISFFVAFFIISYLHIVVGELAPKSMAIRQTERLAIWTAAPLYLFYWSMYPAIWVLNKSANRLLKLIGLSAIHGHEANYSIEELKLILRSGGMSGPANKAEMRVLAQALDFSVLSVEELKRPAGEMVPLHANHSLKENFETISKHRYTRYPLLSREGGDIIGLIHVKDLLSRIENGKWDTDLRKIARPILRVPETMPAAQVFKRFREGFPHFALVTSGAGEVTGFVTLDNLLSVLVGEISDEFRKSQSDWIEQDDGTLLGKGSLSVFSLERALGLDLEDQDADTVAGLIHWKLERLPEEGERIEFDGFDVVVKKMRGPKIQLVKVFPGGRVHSGRRADDEADAPG